MVSLLTQLLLVAFRAAETLLCDGAKLLVLNDKTNANTNQIKIAQNYTKILCECGANKKSKKKMKISADKLKFNDE